MNAEVPLGKLLVIAIGLVVPCLLVVDRNPAGAALVRWEYEMIAMLLVTPVAAILGTVVFWRDRTVLGWVGRVVAGINVLMVLAGVFQVLTK